MAQALQLSAEQRGVRWSDDALLEAIAIAIAEGYPHKVQLVGASTWDAARPEHGATLEVGHVRLGRDQAEATMTDLFQTRWARTTGEQRRVLAAMAAAGGDSTARADVAPRLGVSSPALSRPRDELIDRGLIEPAGHGELRFTIPASAASYAIDPHRSRPDGHRHDRQDGPVKHLTQSLPSTAVGSAIAASRCAHTPPERHSGWRRGWLGGSAEAVLETSHHGLRTPLDADAVVGATDVVLTKLIEM